MEEIMEVGGQAILSSLAAVAIIGITYFMVFTTTGSTLGSFVSTALNYLLP